MARSHADKVLFADKLRRTMTPAERRLWARIGDYDTGRKCQAQRLVCGFIVDFAFPGVKLAIELDGASHDGRERQDANRTAVLWTNGWRVLRFSNERVYANVDAVVAEIVAAFTDRSLKAPRRQAKDKPAKVGDAVQFGCAVRRWKRTREIQQPQGRLIPKT